MKNVLILFLLGILLLFSGIFIVDEREVVVITHSVKDSKIYSTGIHWNLPFYGEISYVYKNERNNFVLIELDNSVTKQFEQMKLNIVWSVNDPIKYVNYLNQYGRKKFDENMADIIQTRVIGSTIKQVSNDVDLISYLKNNPINILDVNSGIKISSVNVSEIKLISRSSSESLPQLSAESAYSEAILIVQNANKEKQQALDKLKMQNPEFYNYYSLIRQYQMTAKNKSDVPAFDKLYSR